MATEKVIKIVVKKDGADSSIKDVKKNLDNTSKSTNALSSQLDKMSGGAVSAFRSLKGGLSSAVNGFKSLRVAIIGTGIGALIIGILAVKEAFTSSEEGQNKFAKIMAVIGSITGNLSDLLSNLGMKIISAFENPQQAIKDFANLIKENVVNRFNGLLELIPQLSKAVKQLFKGDFSGAAQTAGNAVAKVALGTDNLTESIKGASKALKELAKEVAEDAEKAAAIADKRAKADKIERNLIVERATANRKIADLRLKAEKLDQFTAKERVKFLKDAGALEDDITRKEIYAASLRLQAKTAENKLSNSTKDDLTEEANLQAKLINLQTSRLNLRKRLEAKIQTTQKEKVDNGDSAETKAEAANQLKIQEIRDKFKQKNEDLEDEDNLAKLERQYNRDLIELEALGATLEQKRELNTYYAGLIKDEEAQILQDFADYEEKLLIDKENKRLKEAENEIKLAKIVGQAKENILNKTASLLIELGGKAAKVGKAIAVAQTIRSGIEGVQNAYTTAQKSPITALFPAYPIAQAGLAGAFSALQVKKLLSTSDTGGGGATSTTETSAPSFNLVQGTDSNQVANAITNNETPIVKAIVVSSDVTSAQSADRNKISESSI